MNPLFRYWPFRVFLICTVSSLVAGVMLLLANTTWADGYRITKTVAEESTTPTGALVYAMSLAKATILMGTPCLATLGILKLIRRFQR